MSSSHEPPEQNGALSRESKPQVVVRAGKYYVCSSCGTMVEIPADVVGQLVVAVDPVPQATPLQEQPSTPVPINSDVSEIHSDGVAVENRSTLSTSTKLRPPQPKRPKQPQKQVFIGEIIDGLQVPSARQLDRALAWVSFHLQVLDRQGSELKRLQKLLKDHPTSRVPCPGPRGHAKEVAVQELRGPCNHPSEKHAHEEVSMAPDLKKAKGREPP